MLSESSFWLIYPSCSQQSRTIVPRMPMQPDDKLKQMPRQGRNKSRRQLISVDNTIIESGREIATPVEIHAGEIWHVSFGGRVGSRYALVLCAPHFARADVMVCPLTTQLKPRAKSRVRINTPFTSSDIQSEIKCEEIHTVPQSSMHRRIAKCPAATFILVQQVLAGILFGQTGMTAAHSQ